VVDVSVIRELVVILCCILSTVALLAYLALTGVRAVAAETEAAGEASLAATIGMRQFYLTKDSCPPSAAKTACAGGYHMASMWEIADPSNLKYNTSLGLTKDDSGQGPPTTALGWVRTGYGSSTSATAGMGNCAAWSSDSAVDNGTAAVLHADWTGGTGSVGVWSTYSKYCIPGTLSHVWCIED
jgi:hypothetical protein